MSKVGAVHRTAREFGAIVRSVRAIGVNRPYLAALVAVYLTSCATNAHHQFAEPTGAWRARSGQLLYRTASNSLIGDVLVRYSNSGDFELTFSKGPSVTLLVLRQDAQFADAKGPMSGKGWAGPVDHAPAQLRGWLGLREVLLRERNRKLIRYSTSSEKFELRF